MAKTDNNRDDLTAPLSKIDNELEFIAQAVGALSRSRSEIKAARDDIAAASNPTYRPNGWRGFAEALQTITEELNAENAGIYRINGRWAAYCAIDGLITDAYSISARGSVVGLLVRLSESVFPEQNEAAARVLANLPM